LSRRERAFVEANKFHPLVIHEYFHNLGKPTPRWAIAVEQRAHFEVNGLGQGIEDMFARAFRELALKGVGGKEIETLFYDFVKLAAINQALPPWHADHYELFKRTKARRQKLITQWQELERKHKFKIEINDYSTEPLELWEKTLKDINN
jgi:hypothetical protein